MNMALRKNYSTEIKDLEAVKQVAAELGFVQTRGKHRGEGSIRRLLEAIAEGDVYVVPAQDNLDKEEQVEKAIQEMARAGMIGLEDADYVFSNIAPIELPGPPISEQVIADRR